MNTPTPFMQDLGNNTVITAQLTIGQLMLLQRSLKMMTARSALTKVVKEEVDAMIDMFQETVNRDKAGDIPADEIQGYCL